MPFTLKIHTLLEKLFVTIKCHSTLFFGLRFI